MKLKKNVTKWICMCLIFCLTFTNNCSVAQADATDTQTKSDSLDLSTVSFTERTDEIEQLLNSHPTGPRTFSSSSTATLEETIVNGLLAQDATIDIQSYSVPIANFKSVYTIILDNHPELYYVLGSYRYSYLSSGIIVAFSPSYDSTGYDTAALDVQMQKALSCVSASMSDIEKVLAIHDYLVQHITYDYDNYAAGTIPAVSHNMYGAMINQVAVCDGYADSFLYLMNQLGIPCKEITGGGHAWNLVQIGGNWYHIDCTYDDPIRNIIGQVRHDFFLMSDSYASSHDHSWTVSSAYPTCSSTTYDNSFIKNVAAEMLYHNKKWYYIDSSASTYCSYDFSTNTSSLIKSFSYKWYVINSYSYYIQNYSRLAINGSSVLYSTPSEIRKMNYDGTNDTLVQNVSKTGYNLYGMTCASNVVTLQYGITPSSTYSSNYYTESKTIATLATTAPTVTPTITPTNAPTVTPTVTPTKAPTVTPTVTPTKAPTATPYGIIVVTSTPKSSPVTTGTIAPTATSTNTITTTSSAKPTATVYITTTTEPIATATIVPTIAPTMTPTLIPTVAPSKRPTAIPTSTVSPSEQPTAIPTPIVSLPAIGTKVTIGALQYMITNNTFGKREVAVYKYKKKQTTVRIPVQVSINGYNYTVTGILANAFKNNKKVKKVTISSTISLIGAKAFYGCKKLSKVYISSKSITFIGTKAFQGIYKKVKVQCAKKKRAAYKKLFKKKYGKSKITWI